MVVRLSGIFLSCTNVDKSVEFYRCVGVALKASTKAGEKYAFHLDGIHFALTDVDTGNVQSTHTEKLSFIVDQLDVVMADLRRIGAVVREPPTPSPWGIAAVVEDPDGRVVEVVGAHVEWTGPMPL